MTVSIGIIDTPWGCLQLTVGAAGLRRVIFDAPTGPRLSGPWADALAGYLAGHPISPELPVDLSALPPFTQRVLHVCRTIPFGVTWSYAQLADALGCPHAARAVGQALARNPAPLVIPCHRVVGSDGRLTGFLGGLDRKRALLQHEKALEVGILFR